MSRTADGLEKRIGYSFSDASLLETALTHSSYTNESRNGAECYERLEFLGDSVLGMLAADMLFHTHKGVPEGELTRMRAGLVCESSLARAARELGLGEYLRLGRGEERTGGRTRPSILADVMEAIVAALYLDGGIEASRRFAAGYILNVTGKNEDYKTALQERVQAASALPVSYRIIGEHGPDHNKRFEAEVLVGGQPMGSGEGPNKKEAEQLAAREALKQFEDAAGRGFTGRFV